MGYRSFSQAMQARFGTKVYKLSLDGGMTCPNRDGTLGTRGCLFCGETAAATLPLPTAETLQSSWPRPRRASPESTMVKKYIAYFQSFTNTYAPVAYLDHLFTQAIAPEEVVALSIATRPDCLGPEVLELLAHLHEKKSVWVELGLQTSTQAVPSISAVGMRSLSMTKPFGI